ncbi:MAG TPA: hypothetical protein VME24_06580 [Alphaproteobacteria bacterium]|nr:hypothetical protein [Alphaproteobacteria bacterium]
MSVTSYKRLTVILAIVTVASLGLAWHFDMKFQRERWQTRVLWSAIRDFDKMRDMALRSEPKDAVEILDGFATIAPRQGTSPGEMIFEHERQADIREIISYLRQKTGEDLGADPQKWVQKYRVSSRPNTALEPTPTAP